MKLYEILEHLDGQTSSATTEKAGIVKFGTETGNAIDAETWKQAIGQSLGGYVSKVESKEAGRWYINDLTDGKIYKCIQNHTSTSFDITKFVDITNVGLSDKVENLLKVSKEGSVQIGSLLIQWGYINSFSGHYTLVFPVPFHEGTIPAIAISTWQFSEVPLHNGRTNKVCPFHSNNRVSIDWIAIGMA